MTNLDEWLIYWFCLGLILFSIFLLPGPIFSRSVSANFGKTLSRVARTGNARLFLVVVAMFVLGVIRPDTSGTDYPTYIEFYNALKVGGTLAEVRPVGQEIGWHYLNWVVAKSGISYQYFFSAVFCLTIIMFVVAAYPFRKLYTLVFLFGVSGLLFFLFSGIRQGLALGFCAIAFQNAMAGRLLKFSSFVLLGSLFHLSILAIFPFYLLRFILFRRNIAISLYAMSFAFVVFDVFKGFRVIFEKVASSLGFFESYVGYFELERTSSRMSMDGTGLGILLRWAFFLYILLMANRVIKEDPRFNFYFTLAIFYSISYNFFFGYELGLRFLNYFFWPICMCGAAVVFSSSKRHEALISCGFVSAFLLLMIKQIKELFI